MNELTEPDIKDTKYYQSKNIFLIAAIVADSQHIIVDDTQ